MHTVSNILVGLVLVPNAPCGVESIKGKVFAYTPTSSFLMHRVELKVLYQLSISVGGRGVPNAPCGVERLATNLRPHEDEDRFLMHRVELKVLHTKEHTLSMEDRGS